MAARVLSISSQDLSALPKEGKWGRSAEHRGAPEDDDAVNKRCGHTVAASGPVGSAGGGRAETPLDHAHHGFSVPVIIPPKMVLLSCYIAVIACLLIYRLLVSV